MYIIAHLASRRKVRERKNIMFLMRYTKGGLFSLQRYVDNLENVFLYLKKIHSWEKGTSIAYEINNEIQLMHVVHPKFSWCHWYNRCKNWFFSKMGHLKYNIHTLISNLKTISKNIQIRFNTRVFYSFYIFLRVKFSFYWQKIGIKPDSYLIISF